MAWVLSNNYCTFAGTLYHQIKGTAMGTPLAVVFANLFLAAIELPLLTKSTGYTLYQRYIDDIFAVMKLHTAVEFVSNFSNDFPTIKLDQVTMQKHGVFLDLHITLVNNECPIVRVYQKPTNIYQYIPPCSAHHSAVFPSWLLEETKRYRLRCSQDCDYEALVIAFNDRLKARGYPTELLARALVATPARATLMTNISNPNPNPNSNHRGPVLSLTLPGVFNLNHCKHLFTIPITIRTTSKYINAYGIKDMLVRLHNRRSLARYLTRSLFTGNANPIPNQTRALADIINPNPNPNVNVLPTNVN
jgi:hypothetical protein